MSDSKKTSSNGGCIQTILFLSQIIIGILYFFGNDTVSQWETWQLFLPTLIWIGLRALGVIFGLSLISGAFFLTLLAGIFSRENNGKK